MTSDAAVLCFKSGNATILRGGKEAFYSNMAISKCMIRGAAAVCPEFNPYTIQFIPTVQREVIPILLSQVGLVDLCIPRGGESLIRAVAECSHIPVIKHYKGVCHIYLHEDADLDMAERIVINAKTQRPGVCNAVETLLIHENFPHTDELLAALQLEEIKLIDKPESWAHEYGDKILAFKIVKNLDDAINHINKYGSGHTDCIITKDIPNAEKFMNNVDSAGVYFNVSTRFADGFRYGFGAEVGISTNKTHARGPVGLEGLTIYKYRLIGSGQVVSDYVEGRKQFHHRDLTQI